MNRNGEDSLGVSFHSREVELFKKVSRSCVKFIATALLGVGTALTIVGCAVPVIPSAQVNMASAPADVAYVAPTYLVSRPGWIWTFHHRYGWGWYHPRDGWHKGWR
jgi:hypothetical protein